MPFKSTFSNSKLLLSIHLFVSLFYSINNISIISSSSIEKCINSDPSKDISCKSKMLLSLTIQNAELQESDYVETTLNQVADKDGNIQKFSSPIKIVFSKTPVRVLYPCTYFQDFNYQPKENIISTSSTKCSDNSNDQNPTGGWSYSNGQKVKYSQGFCCSCSALSLSKKNLRGVKCSGIFDFSASAHCLSFDPVWYSAYKVDKYKIEYTININVINVAENKTISNLQLSPKNTISINEDKTILVKLIGDFLPTDIFPRDLSNKFLIIPTKPDNSPIIKQGKYRWMLIDKNRFSLDGSECDKIGVGFFAFNTQSEKCNVEIGSCLRNQISHLYIEDIERVKNGKNPEYLIIYDKNYKYSLNDEGFSSRSFSYNLEGNINTLITLEIDTTVLKFVSNVSSGKILNIYINNNFMAMSDDGFMEISIKNTGILTAQYIISYECNNDIIALSSNEISLEPEEIKTFNKSLYTNSNIGKENNCKIILKNSIGETIDMKFISFNTIDEITFNNQEKEDNRNVTYDKKSYQFICEDSCINSLDIFCYINNSCWEMLITKLVILFALIIIVWISCKCFKKICRCYNCIKYFKFICCNLCCCKNKKKKNKKIKSSNDDNCEMENYD